MHRKIFVFVPTPTIQIIWMDPAPHIAGVLML